MMPLPPSRLNISWMLTNREEYLANGLWPTLVTVLVTRGPDTDFSRNTRSDLVPGPRHNCPHSQDRGKPRSLCIFFGPVSFYKALPDDSRGLADWNLRLNSFLSNPSWFTARLWAVSGQWVILSDGLMWYYQMYLIEKAWLPSKYNFPLTQSPLPGQLSSTV